MYQILETMILKVSNTLLISFNFSHNFGLVSSFKMEVRLWRSITTSGRHTRYGWYYSTISDFVISNYYVEL